MAAAKSASVKGSCARATPTQSVAIIEIGEQVLPSSETVATLLLSRRYKDYAPSRRKGDAISGVPSIAQRTTILQGLVAAFRSETGSQM
jgi:hypothetical protein